jgi:tryptophanyl-tRNA synthetase
VRINNMRPLTGIKPTGDLHIGNLLGAIKPAIELTKNDEGFYFVANYHALTTINDKKTMLEITRQVAAAWLALGLDPGKNTFFIQSDIPEVCELTWLLSCVTSYGLLQRAHAFKDALAKNKEVNDGLFQYPVLMAADILLYQSTHVPVGKDQKQHVEITRDIAIKFNNAFNSEVFIIPKPIIKEDVMTIKGIDGQKMSKSYNNVIPLFLPEKKLRKTIMKIVTDSKTVEEPKDPENCNVFYYYRLFATKDEQKQLANRYREGGMGYGEAKQALFEVINQQLAEPRERYNELLNPKNDELEKILKMGADKARPIAIKTLRKARKVTGFNR